jgi:acyl carrier protein
MNLLIKNSIIMSNLEKYDEVFMTNFRVGREQLPVLTYQSVSVWDSIGHMSLVAAIEESFNIMMDTEDIMGFSSYEEGKKILEKYSISI